MKLHQDISRDPADKLLQKYEEKKDAFQKVYEVINSTQEYTNARTEQFVNDLDSLIGNIK